MLLRYLYNVLFYLSIPLILMRLLWKSRNHLHYCRRIRERFGFVPPAQKNTIWVHAVSVGETIAAKALIKQIQATYPDYLIILTTMTTTAAAQVDSLFGGTVQHYFVPYDLPDAVNRFLDRIKPKIAVIMETELWPNFIYGCDKRHIPMLIANARLSAKSAAGYHRFKRFIADVLSKISIIAVQTVVEAERFEWLGAKPSSLIVTGSIKFDQEVPASIDEKAAVFKSMWGQNRLVWVAASTHEGEEEYVLKAHKEILKQIPNALLVLVPRHPERFSRVAALAKKLDFNTILRSSNKQCDETVQVVIGDSMGEMLSYYAASDMAFVGGSLVQVGGHNLLEPAALGIATIVGPHVFNFMEIASMLIESGAVTKINNEDELAKKVIDWLRDSDARSKAGESGRKVVERNRGSLKKHLQIFTRLLDGF